MSTQTTTPVAGNGHEPRVAAVGTPYTCPHCDTTVQVPDQGLGKMVACPESHCGREFLAETQQPVQTAPEPAILLPEGLDRSEPVSTAEPAPVPVAIPVANTPANSAENTAPGGEFRVGLSMVRRYPVRWVGYVLLALAGVVALGYAVAFQSVVLMLLGLAGLGFAAYRMMVWWLHISSSVLIVTPEKCSLETGYFSKQVVAVDRDKITDVQIYQQWLPWMLNVGDLVIVAQEGEKPTQLVLLGVEAPAEVAARIHQKVVEPAADQAS